MTKYANRDLSGLFEWFDDNMAPPQLPVPQAMRFVLDRRLGSHDLGGQALARLESQPIPSTSVLVEAWVQSICAEVAPPST